MKIFKILFFIFLFLYSESYSIEIKSLVKVNEKTITNIDLLKEIKFYEVINKKKINQQEQRLILDQLIDQKIKYLETEKLKININEKILKEKVKLNLNRYDDNIKNSKEINDYIYNKFAIMMKWNSLITSIYASKLEINTNEIKEKIKSNKLKKKDEENLIQLEKQKKINILSKTHFNIIKSKYYIKYIK